MRARKYLPCRFFVQLRLYVQPRYVYRVDRRSSTASRTLDRNLAGNREARAVIPTAPPDSRGRMYRRYNAL